MLENPENKVWLDADTIVATSERQAAIRRCRELAEYNELSCCAFKLYVEGGQDAHPTRGNIYFTMRFKCGLA